MPTLKIDEKDVAVPDGATVLDACRKAGIDVPTMCFLDGEIHFTSCMVCVVKDVRTGRMIPACSAPAVDGLELESETEEVRECRRVALELLLSEHVGDCEAPCHRICPAHMNIPQMIRQIAANELNGALQTVKGDIALPAILGRICPAPCEKGCRRGRQDTAVSICMLKRYVADCDLADGDPWIPECAPSSGKSVAIVGAGPTGLAAAYYLQQHGHACTVLDNRETAGGELTTLDAGLLPPDVIRAEAAIVSKLGATFKYGVTLGVDVAFEDLCRDYDAVVLAFGFKEEDAIKGLGLDLSKTGLKVDKATLQTSREGVFSGGGAIGNGKKMAVRAVADGKAISYSVDQLLKNEPVKGEPVRFNCGIGPVKKEELPEFMKCATESARVEPAEASRGFSKDEAIQEAERCLHCDCRKPATCRLREYAENYGAKQNRYKGLERNPIQIFHQHEQVVFEPGKCIKCGICVRITELEKEPLGMAFLCRGFESSVGVPFGDTLDKGLTATAERCIRCCPTGALSCARGEEQ